MHGVFSLLLSHHCSLQPVQFFVLTRANVSHVVYHYRKLYLLFMKWWHIFRLSTISSPWVDDRRQNAGQRKSKVLKKWIPVWTVQVPFIRCVHLVSSFGNCGTVTTASHHCRALYRNVTLRSLLKVSLDSPDRTFPSSTRTLQPARVNRHR